MSIFTTTTAPFIKIVFLTKSPKVTRVEVVQESITRNVQSTVLLSRPALVLYCLPGGGLLIILKLDIDLLRQQIEVERRGARRKTYRVQVGVPVDEAQHYRGLDLDVIERHLHNLLGIEERIIFVHPIEVLSEKDIWLIVFKDNRDLDLVFVAEDDAQHDRGYDLMASQKCSHQNAL